jgi:hypothetical protein
MALDLAAMLRNAIFETKSRLHSLEQALKHVARSAEPATTSRKGSKKEGRSKATTKKGQGAVPAPQPKKRVRKKRAKPGRRARGPAAPGGSGKSAAS